MHLIVSLMHCHITDCGRFLLMKCCVSCDLVQNALIYESQLTGIFLPLFLDPASVTYILQQQILGSSHWTVVTTGLHQTSHTILALKKNIYYMFRVLTATAKANSKPSPPTEPVQLLDHGKAPKE